MKSSFAVLALLFGAASANFRYDMRTSHLIYEDNAPALIPEVVPEVP